MSDDETKANTEAACPPESALLCGGMTPEQFCYWLNGFGELTEAPPTEEQWRSIKEHLQTVFFKITPVAPGTIPPMTDRWQWPHIMPTITC